MSSTSFQASFCCWISFSVATACTHKDSGWRFLQLNAVFVFWSMNFMIHEWIFTLLQAALMLVPSTAVTFTCWGFLTKEMLLVKLVKKPCCDVFLQMTLPVTHFAWLHGNAFAFKLQRNSLVNVVMNLNICLSNKTYGYWDFLCRFWSKSFEFPQLLKQLCLAGLCWQGYITQ